MKACAVWFARGAWHGYRGNRGVSRKLYGVCQRGNLRCLPGIAQSDAPEAEKPIHAPCSTPRGERASMCLGAPRPDTSSRPPRARRVKSAAHFLARRERSHAQVRPSFTGEASMASTCLFDAPEHGGTRPGWPGSGIVRSPCRCRSDSVGPVPDVGSLGSQRTEGSPPWRAERRVAILYSVGPIRGPDQEAVIRFSGKAPRRRARSGGRHRGRLSGRVATTSDRHR
jgi:hypothetical protein